jgi:hypothetical protein
LLIFLVLCGLAMLTGALLGKYRVSEDKMNWGSLLPLALLIGLELTTGHLVIGRSWNTTVATREQHPRFYWTVVTIETGVFIFGIYRFSQLFPLW